MMSPTELLSTFYAKLAEVENGNLSDTLKNRLLIELNLLVDVLGDDLSDEVYDKFEALLDD